MEDFRIFHCVPVFRWTVCLLSTFHLFCCGDGLLNVRLVDGPSPKEGRVEYTTDNMTWMTTCGVNLGINDVIIICHHLGFPGGNRAITASPFGTGMVSPTTGLLCDDDATELRECSTFTAQCLSEGAAVCYGDAYLGCFEDQTSGLRALPGASFTSSTMTIDRCISFCKMSNDSEYEFAGVEFGKECYCGVAGVNYAQYGMASDAECQTPCSGTDFSSCGGQSRIAVFRIQRATTGSPGVPDLATSGAGQPTVITTPSTSVPRPLGSENNIGLYAGVGGAVAVILLIFVIIIIVVVLKRRSSPSPKGGLSAHEMRTFDGPSSPPADKTDNVYDGLYHDITDENAVAAREQNGQKHLASNSAPTTFINCSDNGGFYSSVDESVKVGEANRGSELYATADEPEKMAPSPIASDDFGGLYAKPDKSKTAGDANLGNSEPGLYSTADEQNTVLLTTTGTDEVDLSAMYAMPDKSGLNGNESADFDAGALYAMPDKTRPAPDGSEVQEFGDLYAKPDKTRGNGVSPDESGVYATADDIPIHALYAMPDKQRSRFEEDEDNTVMVENELYTV